MRNFNIIKPASKGATQKIPKSKGTSFTPFYAKVLTVNTVHSNYPLGAIKFETLERGTNVTNVAVPFSTGIKQYPLVGELVQIHPKSDGEGYLLYSLPSNTQNNTTTNIVDESYAEYFGEREDINLYQPINGDILIEGRHGQSLRFSHIIESEHPWKGIGTLNSGITILSTGQPTTEDGRDYILEDINENKAIIALLEDSTLPLKDLSKRASYDQDIQSANSYRGSQLISNSNRIYLNAREDSILLSAQSGSVGLSGNTVNLDGITSIRLDAPFYNLQADTFTTTNQERTIDSETSTYNFTQFDVNGTNINVNYNRIGLGENAAEPLLQSTEFLTDMVALNVSLTQLATALSGVVGLLTALPGGQAPAAILQTAATAVSTQANNIQTKVASGNYLSTTVFTK